MLYPAFPAARTGFVTSAPLNAATSPATGVPPVQFVVSKKAVVPLFVQTFCASTGGEPDAAAAGAAMVAPLPAPASAGAGAELAIAVALVFALPAEVAVAMLAPLAATGAEADAELAIAVVLVFALLAEVAVAIAAVPAPLLPVVPPD